MIDEWKKVGALDHEVPVKFWVDPSTIGKLCREQITNLMKLPFAVKHIAVMPDAHPGYGMPIGCVLATDNVVIPNAVGVDIGCGMLAAKVIDVNLKEVRSMRPFLKQEVLDRVPVGRNWHPEKYHRKYMPQLPMGAVVEKEFNRARRQLGTLGGGNHFIEIQIDTGGDIWIMVHSGSRNLGKQVCDFYNAWAKDDNAMHYSQVTADVDLAFFHRKHDGYSEYVTEMNYCIDFAKRNRTKMLHRIMAAFQTIWPGARLAVESIVDICHNHMSIENHLGHNVHVHRKGAAGPYRGGWGIIPGSMGSKSYIVSHKGVVDSFDTTSHGAGRPMSRNDAKKTLDLKEQRKILDDLGVMHDLKTIKDLEEAPGAYNDIDEVMANQSELCNVEVELKPILSVKGE